MKHVESTCRGPATVVRLKGPLVDEVLDELSQHATSAISAGVGRVVFDASEIPFADSQGIELLLDVADQLGTIGQPMRFASISETLREIFEITGVADRFDYYEDVPQAVRSLS